MYVLKKFNQRQLSRILKYLWLCPISPQSPHFGSACCEGDSFCGEWDWAAWWGVLETWDKAVLHKLEVRELAASGKCLRIMAIREVPHQSIHSAAQPVSFNSSEMVVILWYVAQSKIQEISSSGSTRLGPMAWTMASPRYWRACSHRHLISAFRSCSWVGDFMYDGSNEHLTTGSLTRETQ